MYIIWFLEEETILKTSGKRFAYGLKTNLLSPSALIRIHHCLLGVVY